jgi:proline iminopeptidase
MDYFPAVEHYDEGWLDTGDGHRVFWTISGNPEGVPALIVHGGPGSGSSPGQRRMWDPSRYWIIQLDQRNCGRSTPPASNPAVPLTNNTTHHLIWDMELLRKELGVERWVLWGGSWGTTLALAYAERYPSFVHALILVFMMLGRKSDFRWLYHEMGRYFPSEWSTFVDGAAGKTDDLLAAYDHLLNETHDEQVQRKAARNWIEWENVISSLDPGWESSLDYDDLDHNLQFARVTTHYFNHGAWLDENEILVNAGNLDGIPGVIIHGRQDRANPYDMAWLLAQVWRGSELVTLPQAGHTPTNPAARDALLTATNRFADLLYRVTPSIEELA